ncbi:DUF4102 domain-containing protein [Formicincola oecophyllae]|uniref:DUF4102 domain-containing protein n=1 Tax=Formicincola oecophyllae TaxID=2558361 RepID=A0A4Y6U967_9PROT|nr:site-specific integrase [Formicincola oecophyllae]QDH12996.1 DUF4102 domain-containing protein [Formicincola oecophyllae]
MGRRQLARLTDVQVRKAPAGKHADGGNLYLLVSPTLSRSWVFRYRSPLMQGADGYGRLRHMGLGAYPVVSLMEARHLAAQARRELHEGRDPLLERTRRQKAAKLANCLTLEEVAETFITQQAGRWSDRRGASTWRQSLAMHVYPTLGSKAVATITREEVAKCLLPVWENTHETASRIRARLEAIFRYAIGNNLRTDPNPAQWKGMLEFDLPAPAKVKRVKHFHALPLGAMPAFMKALEEAEGMGALVVRFIALTCVRSGEARRARWEEIDLEAKVWTIPPERMKVKNGQPHRVPLSTPAVALLEMLWRFSDKKGLVFPSVTGRALSDVAASKAAKAAAGDERATVHGLRSTFRDWATETGKDWQASEMCLAHNVRSAVEAAYSRTDQLEKRRTILEEWGNIICPIEKDAFLVQHNFEFGGI